MNIRIASENDKERWNQFVDREGGSFFQYYDWKFVYEFKKQNRYLPLLIQDSNSDIIGIFPLVEQMGSRIYPRLSSLPEGATGGYLLSNSLSFEKKNLILELFFEFINNNYSHTHTFLTIKAQIRIEKNGSIDPLARILLENGYQWLDNTSTKLPCTHYLKLETPFEEKIWNDLWSKRLRKRIRHTQKTGLHVILDNDLKYLDNYCDMYSESLKKFDGVADKEKIELIFNIFQNKIKLFIGLLDSKPISAALCFHTPKTFYLSKAPYLPIACDYLTNTLPIYTSIQYACNSGYDYYEMGITTTPELAFHKEKFGATRFPMRVYSKTFSHFKTITNNIYGTLRKCGKKTVGSLRY